MKTLMFATVAALCVAASVVNAEPAKPTPREWARILKHLEGPLPDYIHNEGFTCGEGEHSVDLELTKLAVHFWELRVVGPIQVWPLDVVAKGIDSGTDDIYSKYDEIELNGVRCQKTKLPDADGNDDD